jgi:hypothetical protein
MMNPMMTSTIEISIIVKPNLPRGGIGAAFIGRTPGPRRLRSSTSPA